MRSQIALAQPRIIEKQVAAIKIETDSSAPESGNRASAPGRLWTIPCIEDDPECSSLIGEELKERGFAVVVAHDGEEGLSLLLNSSVDLVLSDINMPGMSGFEVLEKFKELAPDSPIPFIFLTGLGDREDEIAGRMLGADDYVRKPVDFEILQTIIAARLRGAAPLVPGSTSGALSGREREALTWQDARGNLNRGLAGPKFAKSASIKSVGTKLLGCRWRDAKPQETSKRDSNETSHRDHQTVQT